jgi:hypothetical protein
MEYPPIYYVYGLYDPRNNELFYIGKGKGNRMMQHLRKTTNGSKKNERIAAIRLAGYEPYAKKLYDNLLEKVAYDIETELIVEHGRIDIDESGTLTNNRLKAFPPVMTSSVRNAISKARKGTKFSDEHRARLSAAKKGKTYEEIFGEEGAKKRRAQLAEKRSGMTQECKNNISKAKKGKAPHEWKEAARKKLSETTKGISKPLSESHKESIRAISKIERQCSYCLKTGTGNSMFRWHFDNCKAKNV